MTTFKSFIKVSKVYFEDHLSFQQQTWKALNQLFFWRQPEHLPTWPDQLNQVCPGLREVLLFSKGCLFQYLPETLWAKMNFIKLVSRCSFQCKQFLITFNGVSKTSKRRALLAALTWASVMFNVRRVETVVSRTYKM
jgi:hypothetical protein